MKLSIFGLGYVGLVTAVCLAKLGHDVTGVDISKIKISQLERLETPIKEDKLDSLLLEVMKNKKFNATSDISLAVKNSEVSFVCVRSPLRENDDLDISEIDKVCENIAEQLMTKRGTKHVIAIRSTVTPGSVDRLYEIFKKKGLTENVDFIIVANPEFLREGTAVKDFFEPPHVVIGSESVEGSEIVASVYKDIKAPIYKVSTRTAEAIKFVNNAWHALEMSFVNEVSSICKAHKINSKELIDLFSSDTKLNISPYYLRPNMGYGGSCLPKDLGALQQIGVKAGINCELLNAVSKSNIQQIKRAYKVIKGEAQQRGKNEIGIFGVAFKPGTDDIRGSPILYIIEKLRSDGFSVKIYDPIVKKSHIENIRNSYRDIIYDPLLSDLMEVKNFKDLLDDIERMLCPLEEVLKCSVVVISAKMQWEDLQKLTEEQVLVNTRAVIPIDNKNELKAKYVEVW
jgi:GDP-mannose 6-dehydrogenase